MHLRISWGLSGKESICQCRRPGFNPWVRKTPWKRKWWPTPVFLPGKSNRERTLTGYSPWGCKRAWHNLETKQQKLKWKYVWKTSFPIIPQILKNSPASLQKTCPFHPRGLECKSRKLRNTWNNRQVWPWSTKLRRAKANRFLPRECIGHSKHPLSTTQEISPGGQYWNQVDYILCSWRWRSSIQIAKTRPGADCGSDHKLLIAKFRHKLKKVWKT